MSFNILVHFKIKNPLFAIKFKILIIMYTHYKFLISNDFTIIIPKIIIVITNFI